MRKLGLLAAMVAMIAVPVEIAAAQDVATTQSAQTTQTPQHASERRVCTVEGRTGSRLGARTRCRSAEEARLEQIEARRVVDRLQAFKPTICSPQPGC